MRSFFFHKEGNGQISVVVVQNDVYEHLEAYHLSKVSSFGCTGTPRLTNRTLYEQAGRKSKIGNEK